MNPVSTAVLDAYNWFQVASRGGDLDTAADRGAVERVLVGHNQRVEFVPVDSDPIVCVSCDGEDGFVGGRIGLRTEAFHRMWY